MRTSLFTDSMPALPDDAEVKEITRYTGGLMTPAEARAFENRLTTDRAFFYRTAPMLKMWYARKPSPAEVRMLRGAPALPAVVERHVRGEPFGRPRLTPSLRSGRRYAELAVGSLREI